MSVLVIAKIPGDTAIFRKTLSERADELRALAEQAKAAGAIHHRFGIGDGFVVVMDQWESPHQFEQFFAQPELQAFIGSSGASGPPDVIVCEATASPDEF